MRSLIIGKGQIGTALGEVLKDYNPVFLDFQLDLHIATAEFVAKDPIDIMHICFTYSDKFVQSVKNYQKVFKPKHTVIHATVPVGTSRKCGAVHSPVTGIHPHLESGIRTFTKFLAGEGASEVADYFRRAGLKVYICDDPETTELGKLSQTTFYALMVEYVKDLKRQCKKLGVPFSEAYTLFSQNYNQGYEKLGYPEFKMPLLVPIMTEQGGHCTIPNCDLWTTDFTKFVKQMNAK